MMSLSVSEERTPETTLLAIYIQISLDKNIRTFIDDQLNRGDEISQSLVNAIEASAISKEYGQVVIPVFYRVDPSDVRNQTGSFGDSFSKLEERSKENSEKLQTWRNALKEAASSSGFPSQNIGEDNFNGFWKYNCVPEAVRFFFDNFDRFPPLECECCGVKKCGVHLLYIRDSTDSMEVPSSCFNSYEED
ncbi:hypothetical protein WN943_015675 [Citrus x changshan-huyou]